MSSAKVTLSPEEQELVANTDWILTKNRVIQKVYALFGDVAEAYRRQIQTQVLFDQEQVLTRSPKISKGEQYEGLPWVMLDYPRHYLTTDSFGIRTFFWWGNGFSITLQLSGKYLQQYAEQVQQYLADSNISAGWLIGVGADPWQHHFREDNYQPYANRGKQALTELWFIKLTKRFPLSQWDNMETLLEKSFMEILQMLLTGAEN